MATEQKTAGKPRCGLCGKTSRLTRTECCGNWICDDEADYQMFSYARNSCHRNHWRYTLCGFHFNEEHKGHWKDCEACRKDFETEIYVYYGTNEYNFDKLENPPEFEPTLCSRCGKVINLGLGGYSFGSDGYTCWECGWGASDAPKAGVKRGGKKKSPSKSKPKTGARRGGKKKAAPKPASARNPRKTG
jgi:hypothetical protein